MATLLEQLKGSSSSGSSNSTLLGQLKGDNPFSFKEDILKPVGETLLSTVDLGASLAHGVSMFPFQLGSEMMGQIGGMLTPRVTGKELASKYGEAVSSLTLQPGMLTSLFTGKPPGEEDQITKSAELVNKGFEALVPTKLINDNIAQLKYLGVNEGIADQLGFWLSKTVELASLLGYGEIGKGLYNKAKTKLDSVNTKIKDTGKVGPAEKAEVDAILNELKEEAAPIVNNLQKEGLLLKEGDASQLPLKLPGAKERETRTLLNDLRKNQEVKSDFQKKQKLMEMLDRKVAEVRAKKEALRPVEKEAAPVKEEITSTKVLDIPKEEVPSPKEAIDFGRRQSDRRMLQQPSSKENRKEERRVTEPIRKATTEELDALEKELFGSTVKEVKETSFEGKKGKIEIDAVHYSREPLTEINSIEGEAGENYLGYGFYAAEANKISDWVDTGLLGEYKNNVIIKTKNPLLITPDTINSLLSEASSARTTDSNWFNDWAAKQVKNGPYDSIIIRDMTGTELGESLLLEDQIYVPANKAVKVVKLKIEIKETPFKGKTFKGKTFNSSEELKNHPDYEVYGSLDEKKAKLFDTAQEAQTYLDSNKRILKAREQLNIERGSDLEVIKVGNKYRFAEPLRASETEFLKLGEIAEEALATKAVAKKMRPEEVREFLKYQQELYEKGDIDITELEGTVSQLFELVSKHNTSDISDGVGRALEIVRKEKRKIEEEYESSIIPKENVPGVFVGKHPVSGNDVIYSPEGTPFKSALDAIDYIEKMGIKGQAVVDEVSMREAVRDADGNVVKYNVLDGFVVDTSRKPERVKFTPAEEKARMTKEELAEADRIDNEFLEATKSRWESIVEAFSKPLRNEEGAIKVSVEQVESIQKLVERVTKAGKSIREYLTELGFDNEKIARMEEAVKIVFKKASEDNQKKQDFVNIGKMERKTRSGIPVTRPKISREILGELQGAKDIPLPKASNIKGLQTMREIIAEYVPTVFRTEQTGSKYVKDLQNRIWEIVDSSEAELKEVSRKFNSLSKGLGRKSFDRVGLKALWEQPDIQERMVKDGITLKDIPALTPGETKLYHWIRESLDVVGNDLIKVMSENNVSPFKKKKNYFTVMYSEGIDSITKGVNSLFDPEKSVEIKERAYKEKIFNSKKKRSKEGLELDFETNVKKVFFSYMKSALEYKNSLPLITEINEILKPLDTGKRAKTKKGKEKIVTFALKKEKPGLYTFLRRLNNQFAGRDPNALGIMNPREERLLKRASNNIASSMIGFLARTGLVQFSAFRNTIPLAGWMNTTKGLLYGLHPGKIKEAFRESPFLRTSLSDAELNDIFKGGVIGKGKRAATLHIKYMDLWTRAVSYMAFKDGIIDNNAKIKSGKLKGTIYEGKDLIREAERMTAKTQSSGLVTDVAPIQRSAIGKALNLLQTFTIGDWNYFYKDILGVGKEGLSYRRRGMTIFNYMLATAAFNYLFEEVIGIDSPFPSPINKIKNLLEEGEDPGEITKEVLFELLSPVPGLFGGLRYDSSLFGLVVDTIDSGVEAINEGDWSKATEMGARISGIPGSRQVAKMYNQYKKGEENPYRYIMGQPPDTPYRKKKEPSL